MRCHARSAASTKMQSSRVKQQQQKALARHPVTHPKSYVRYRELKILRTRTRPCSRRLPGQQDVAIDTTWQHPVNAWTTMLRQRCCPRNRGLKTPSILLPMLPRRTGKRLARQRRYTLTLERRMRSNGVEMHC